MGKSWKKAGKLEMAAKKGAAFTKVAREIQVAAKLGGPDPASNARLKMAVDAARAISCPKDTIERAIKKGSGQLEDEIIEELTYEGYGPHGVGIIVECQTNNKTRTVSELRMLFKSNGGNLGEQGAVNWMFERVSQVGGKKSGVGDLEEEAIEVGANEVEAGNEENEALFYGAPVDLDQIRTALVGRGWEITSAELSYKAKDKTALDDAKREEVITLLDELDELDDSHRVHATI